MREGVFCSEGFMNLNYLLAWRLNINMSVFRKSPLGKYITSRFCCGCVMVIFSRMWFIAMTTPCITKFTTLPFPTILDD